MGGDGGEEREVGKRLGGGGKHGIHGLIRLTALPKENFMSSSFLSREGKIKGLVSNSSLLLLL